MCVLRNPSGLIYQKLTRRNYLYCHLISKPKHHNSTSWRAQKKNVLYTFPRRKPIPAIPSTIPTEINRHLLERWIRNLFKSIAFYTWTHQPLENTTGRSLDISFVPYMKTLAVYTGIIVLHHWKKRGKEDLDRVVTMGIIEPVSGTISQLTAFLSRTRWHYIYHWMGIVDVSLCSPGISLIWRRIYPLVQQHYSVHISKNLVYRRWSPWDDSSFWCTMEYITHIEKNVVVFNPVKFYCA